MAKTTINKLEQSIVEIVSSIDAEKFSSYEESALARIGEMMEVAGFRKGKAPADIIKKNLKNDMIVLEEMAQMAIYDAYPQILEEEKIDAIGRPEISITKIAKGSDLEFKIKTATLPVVSLADYKKIAQEEGKKEEHKEEINISEEEIAKVIEDLRKMRAHQNMPPHEHEDGEEHADMKEEDLPKVDDEFAKSFGKFENVEDLKSKIKENLKIEKETVKKDKKRMAIVEKIIENTKVEVPEILIQSEIDKLLHRLESDIANAGFKKEDYLKQIGKTEEDLRNEWHSDGEKRAKLELIIHEISNKENLKAEKEEIEKEALNITKMYKEADPVRAKAYVEQMLTNEKVFNFLENQ
jgi:trigger factor